MILKRDFFERDTAEVARELLGKVLVNGRCKGVIVETEAYYGPDDPASHAYGRVTKRNSIMYGPAGVAYVYFTYGNHWMFNVVTEEGSRPGAVLVRAVQPVDGVETMMRRRGTKRLRDLTSGPGKLTQAFAINKHYNYCDITKGEFHIEEENGSERLRIARSPRIGISEGRSRLLRFYVRDSPFVSRFR